jgi:hypothetical protein
MEALILVATAGAPTMFARIGIMRALNRHVARVSILTRRTIIGDAESWRGIDDHKTPNGAIDGRFISISSRPVYSADRAGVECAMVA